MNNTQTYEKKRKRKIFLSILMILFVGIILTASTYAWFTANQTVTVQTIDVNVAAQNGLQISTDGTSWSVYSSIPLESSEELLLEVLIV